MAAEEHTDLLALKSRLGERSALWKEMKTCESQVDLLQAKYMEVRASIGGSEEEPEKDLDTLSQKVKTAATLLTYLKTRARTMAVPRLAEASCGIKQLEGVGLVDKDGVPLSSWSKFVDLSSFDGHGYKTYTGTSDQSGLVSDKDEANLCNLLNSVHMVTSVMENLVKRVLIAESETAWEKEKVYFSQEEIKKKDSQLESMSLKLKEMERCAFRTNGILNEMQQRVEDLVNETSRQRQRAAENEQELTRVKRDFENMKSYVSSLISVRETLISFEKQFQTIEKFFERLQNAPPVTYTEHKEEKSKRIRDIVLEEGAKPEFYTEEDEKLLGNTEMPWTFFVDGYREDGTRIYDLVNGKTCHQCRQKTLGQRTRCFKCNLVQVQFCGDCLFMRYGEHVVEANQNPEWVCPPCRGICNCSLCRQAKGWA